MTQKINPSAPCMHMQRVDLEYRPKNIQCMDVYISNIIVYCTKKHPHNRTERESRGLLSSLQITML